MSTNIKIRRSAVPGRVPTTEQLNLGEIAINTADGKIYFKKYDAVSNTESIIDASSNLDPDAILNLLSGVDGANSGLDADLLDGQHGSYYLDYNNFVNVPPATFDLTLSGKVTGTAFSNTGVMTLITELANTGVTPGTYGSPSLVPVVTIDEDGRITSANTVSVAGVANTSWDSSNNTFTIETADGGSYSTLIDSFTNLTINGGTGKITFDSTVAPEIANGDDSIRIVMFGDGYSPNTAQLYVQAQDVWLNSDLKVSGNTNIDHHLSANNAAIINHLVVGSLSVLGNIDTPSQTDSGTLVANSATFEWLTVNNDIVVNGTVDGRDIAADGIILDSLAASTTTVNLTGKVTGSAVSNNNIIDITTELSNTGVVANTYGSSTAIPVITIDEDGRITVANTASVAGVNDFYWVSSNNTLTLETGDGSTYLVPIQDFADITVNDLNANNIIVSGLIDGRDVAADGSKLDGIEAGATADQSNTEIFNAVLSLDGDGSNLDADLLDGQQGTYYLDYGNFSNTAALLTDILSIDGPGSGIDADKLDGYDAAGILDAAANTAGSLVGNGRVTINGGNAIDVSAINYFDLNDANNTTITVNHADTSSIGDTSLTLPNVVTSLTFDTYGHVQTVGSSDLDTRYYTETELNNGQLDSRYYTETELDNGQLDNRYYTETEADNKFVDVTGDTMSGALTVNDDINQQYSSFISATSTLTALNYTAIYAFPYATVSGGEIVISAKRGVDTQITKLLVTHNGSTVVATEFGTVYTNSLLADYEVSFFGPAIQLLARPTSSTSTVFNIAATLIKS